MALAPLLQDKEISLLLDRSKVAVTNQRIALSEAVYKGRDDDGRPFSLTARRAVQLSSQEPVVNVTQLAARMQLSDGMAEVTAHSGVYDFGKGQVAIPGSVNVVAPGGYRLKTSDVRIDLHEQRLEASGGVRGALPTGSFSANTMMVDLEGRSITLQGNVRLHMTPGKLSLPR